MATTGSPTPPPSPTPAPTPAKPRGCSLAALGATGVAFLGLLALLAWVLIERSGEDDPANLKDPTVIAGDVPQGVAEGDECLLAGVLDISVGDVRSRTGDTSPMFPKASTVYEATVTITSSSQVPVRILVFRNFAAGTAPDDYLTGTRVVAGASTTEEIVAEAFEDGSTTWDVVTFAVAHLDTDDCTAQWSGVEDITAFGTAAVAAPNPLPVVP